MSISCLPVHDLLMVWATRAEQPRKAFWGREGVRIDSLTRPRGRTVAWHTTAHVVASNFTSAQAQLVAQITTWNQSFLLFVLKGKCSWFASTGFVLREKKGPEHLRRKESPESFEKKRKKDGLTITSAGTRCVYMVTCFVHLTQPFQTEAPDSPVYMKTESNDQISLNGFWIFLNTTSSNRTEMSDYLTY